MLWWLKFANWMHIATNFESLKHKEKWEDERGVGKCLKDANNIHWIACKSFSTLKVKSERETSTEDRENLCD